MAPRPRFIPAIASQSIGRAPHHDIETKLPLIAAAGFHAIELFMEDLELVATRMRDATATSTAQSTTTALSDDHLLAAAHYIFHLCRHHHLSILCLQPFANYEGLLFPTAHSSRVTELRLWLRLAQALDTDLIQIPSSYLSASLCTGDRTRVVADLREAADLGLQCKPRVIRFAHEALAWATHASRWTDVWEIVEQVDRPNFGTCLDTFNLLGREWADPTAVGGRVQDSEEVLRRTLADLRTKLARNPGKVFYVEACDGERLERPLVEGHEFFDELQPARMSWSRNARLFPCEEDRGGYLPVCETLRVIIEATGYQGYVSFEFFSRTAHQKDEEVPREHAERARTSWQRLCEEMGWEDCTGVTPGEEAEAEVNGKEKSRLREQEQEQQVGRTMPAPAHQPRLATPLQAH